MERDQITLLPRQHDEDLVIHENLSPEEDLKKIIRKLGLKVTTQRILILQMLYNGNRHATAQELYERLIKINSEIGFATVYRFLKSLTEGQFITETRIGGLPARYEISSKNHHDHITCEKCGKICEFENKAIESLQVKVAEQFGFQLTHHVLELYGICLSCQNSSNVSK